MTKSIALAKARGQVDVVNISFNADTDAKKKLDSSGIQYFTLAYSEKAFKIIKNKSSAKDMVIALKDCYEENEIEGYMNLLEKFTMPKLSDYNNDIKEWILELEDINL